MSCNSKNKLATSLGILTGIALGYKLISSKKCKPDYNKISGKNILVTGTSTGIGKSIVEELAKYNCKVFATVRKKSDAEMLEKISNNIIPIIMDVAKHDSIVKAKEEVKEKLNGEKLYSIINNAGIAIAGPLELLPLDDLRWQYEVNVIGLIDTTQQFIELMDKNDSKIINISSIGGRVAQPFVGPYTSSKHALEALSDSMRRELMGTGIDVIVIQPGSIKTPIWDKADQIDVEPYKGTKYYNTMNSMKKFAVKNGEKGAEPVKVSETVIKALSRNKNKSRYIVSRNIVGEVYFVRYMPDRILDKVIKKVLKI